MHKSKLTSKYQVTIPKEIRKLLKLKAGDTMLFEILLNGTICIKKVNATDSEYQEALANEWNSEYDEADFEHLQTI